MFKKISLLITLAFLAGCTTGIQTGEVYSLYGPAATPRVQPHSEAESAFVISMFNRLQRRSISENREYCGYIGLNNAGAFIATPAKRGEPASCKMPDIPPGIRVLATYHTHAAYDKRFDNEVPSINDLQGDISLQRDGYVSTPGGRVWLNIGLSRRTILLCGPNCIFTDPGFVPDPKHPVPNQFSVVELRNRQR